MSYKATVHSTDLCIATALETKQANKILTIATNLPNIVMNVITENLSNMKLLKIYKKRRSLTV